MQKIRNAVIIIVLCIISGYQSSRPAPHLSLPPADSLRDALAGDRAINASRPALHLSNSDDDQLRDSVAGNAIPGFHGPHGNTEDGTPPPPRGGGDGGVGTFSNGYQPPPGPKPLSPSAPSSPYQPTQQPQ
jgi:hypothetical protein